MIAWKIKETKAFMEKLLLQGSFDGFLVSEAVITTYNTFTIDGSLKREFYTKEELEESGLSERTYSLWSELRTICLDLIKGKKTPLNFKFVFLLSRPNTEKLLSQTMVPFRADDIHGLFLNVKFNGTSVTCTTGTSLKMFTMDKSLENCWDQMVERFFQKQGIDFEKIG